MVICVSAIDVYVNAAKVTCAVGSGTVKTSPVPIRIGALPDERFAPAVESTAYTVVADAVQAATNTVAVRVERTGGTLVVEVRTRGPAELDIVHLEDRVGALDGRIDVTGGPEEAVTIRAVLPCEW